MTFKYLKPLCGTDPILVLEFSMLVLESWTAQTIDLFLSGNIPADLVNSYLKQHASEMQVTYLEHMLAMDKNGISGSLQNEMLGGVGIDKTRPRILLTGMLPSYVGNAVLDFPDIWKWDEKTYTPRRKRLISALEISGYNPEILLKRLPSDALNEERAIHLGKMNQHELTLPIYIQNLNVPELALSNCDRVYESGLHQQSGKPYGICLTLLQIYLNPRKTTRNFEKRISNLVVSQSPGILKIGPGPLAKPKGRLSKKIAAIGGAEDSRMSPSSTDSRRSDGDADDGNEEGASTIICLIKSLIC
ncbi:hypothetical protein ACH5RR_033286 [Cinchona calisaya]|uniref:Uncharacterized protein n=1 Tax=Cinchona calisaya TaxID=153742 RepID=A0ABD2YMR6_9GENT